MRVEQFCGYRRGQARAHGGERVVEQQCVGDMGAVIAREPDLVHAVVETNDAVLRHHGADVVHEALRNDRKLTGVGALVDVREDVLAKR